MLRIVQQREKKCFKRFEVDQTEQEVLVLSVLSAYAHLVQEGDQRQEL